MIYTWKIVTPFYSNTAQHCYMFQRRGLKEKKNSFVFVPLHADLQVEAGGPSWQRSGRCGMPQQVSPPSAPARLHNSAGIEYSYVAYQALLGGSPHSKWKLSVGERKWRVFWVLNSFLTLKGVSWYLERELVSLVWLVFIPQHPLSPVSN